jgi:hypothetical protein
VTVKRAKKLYEDFRETSAKRTRKIRLKLPRAVAVMGYCEAILYSTTHNGVAKLYKHKFAKGSRALLCAGPGKSQLYLIGGRFHVTERGIVDLTPSGKEIPD